LKIARAISLGRLYEIVGVVDRAGHTHYRSALQEFLSHRHRLTRYQGNHIWTSAGEYVTQLAEAYQWCLARCMAGASGAADVRTHVTRIIGRVIRLRAAAGSGGVSGHSTEIGDERAPCLAVTTGSGSPR
jgi:hypothetical protein